MILSLKHMPELGSIFAETSWPVCTAVLGLLPKKQPKNSLTNPEIFFRVALSSKPTLISTWDVPK